MFRAVTTACVALGGAAAIATTGAGSAGASRYGSTGHGPLVAGPAHAAASTAAEPAQACGASGWVKIKGVPGGITSIGGSPDFEFLFAGTFAADATDHLFRGTALDAAWLGVPDLASIRVTAVAVGPGSDPKVWVGERGGGVYASDNGGATFGFTGLASSSVTALLPITSTVLAAASAPLRSGIYGWDDGSNAWQLRGGSGISSPILYALAADSLGSLWLGTESAGLWRSDDSGLTWNQVSVGGNTSSTVIAVAPDPAAPLRIYIGHGLPLKNPPSPSDVNGAHVTQNGGVSWDRVLTDIRDITGIAPLRTIAGSAYAAGWGRGLLHTADGGITWRNVPGPVDPVAGDASQHVEVLKAFVPRGTIGCELLLAGGGGGGGLWARNVANTTYHSVYLPFSRCGSDHCTAPSAGTTATPAAPLRFDVAPR